jgi:hypothetical protein
VLGKNLYGLADVHLNKGEILHLNLAHLNLSSGIYLLSIISDKSEEHIRIVKD